MRPPYYESRYIRANHRNLPRALWLRETRLLPTTGPACADVWVMLFDPDGAGNRAIKRSYPIDAAQFDDWTVRIADTTLDDHHARGDIGAARWDLTITPGGAGPVRLLTERAYQARIPTAKTTVRDPLARFDGLLELDTTLVDLDGWAGSVNHNWGTRHTPAYAYGQICGFDGHPESTLELVTARAALGPVLLPGVTLFVFRHEGIEFAVRSVRDSLKTHGRYQPFVWRFGGRVGEKMIEGEIVAEPSDVLGLTYTDTDGTTKYCYNSALATCRIQVAGKAFTRAELTATRRVMFEILTDTPHPDITPVV
ncbi:Uncharacterised protein [Mycolicibacterium phlei]|uniref:Uncharacterized protein n=1 Tax=Mycolicibacterium phlei DSM 43239 = CCUG 21000 TaxID=1226750 RepID=A0A5N5UQL8_MYCPH|nr:hypothetical protein [Mycolicibacterium phlei]VEG11096.1 Uncharacterised protein [Mycobacteroides chelonae]AMO62996.1 hypothetical protein MPHLCCUG_04208 [Mycolicibacterium phlei]KAB7751896.1 hypothetical protein MPHL21000_22200 [Mycolicibacterium phlei DSM 43239 = CCUG 21000]KXW60493.1 hypothetical protein MPHL43239_23925 [Mycolicibacterium phlei DSM 43239 = CCUG 21000]KXW74102.1 hypothetical protein MPHL43070_08445 [Mycolicibacterium phlei DSM 43070]